MTTSHDVIVTAFDDADHECARALAQSLDVPFIAGSWLRSARFALAYDTENRLALFDAREPNITGIVVRFDTLSIKHGRVQVSRKEPLGRAIGSHVETVVDATAGLGQDAFLLACMGFHVTAIERSPIVAALLEDGLRRIRDMGRYRDAIGDRLRVVIGDARTVLRELDQPDAPQPPDAPSDSACEDRSPQRVIPVKTGIQRHHGDRLRVAGFPPAREGHGVVPCTPDAIYLDPMFPPKRKKSALAKKPLRLLRDLVGDDDDTLELFDVAIKSAGKRVIVKRPDDAPPLAPRPAASITGKLVRYDIYSPAASLGSSLRIQQ